MRQFIIVVLFAVSCAHQREESTELFVVHHLALDYTYCVLLPGGQWPRQCRAVERVFDGTENLYQVLRPFSGIDTTPPEPGEITAATALLTVAVRREVCRAPSRAGRWTVWLARRAAFAVRVDSCRGPALTAQYALLR